MKVRYDEGIAIHIGPEPCIAGRKARGEASVGECIGQPWSRESIKSGCRRCAISGRQHGRAHLNASARTARRGQRPWHVHTLLVSGNREISRSTVQQKLPVRVGKVRSRSR